MAAAQSQQGPVVWRAVGLLGTLTALLLGSWLLCSPAQAQSSGPHGFMAVSELYEMPGNFVTRATVATWNGPFALTENIYFRMDAALSRPIQNLLDSVPALTADQHNTDFRIDLGSLPLALGPAAAGVGVSLLDTTTFHFNQPIGAIHAGEDYVIGFGAYLLAGLVLSDRLAVFGHKGIAWVSEGLEHSNMEIVTHVRLSARLGLTASWARGALGRSGAKPLVEYETWTFGLGTLMIY